MPTAFPSGPSASRRPVPSRPGITALGGLAALLAASDPALAQSTPAPHADGGHTAWMLTATALVLLMTLPGVALFYGGMVRRKNVLSTMTQTIAIAAVVTLTWMCAGYSLALRPGSPFLGGLDRLFLDGLQPESLAGSVPETVYAMFQLTFAIITTALVPGAFAERMKFPAVLLFAALWSLLVYAPVAHWVWEPGGWLAAMGALDYAGGTVVHINAGVAGLVCALVLGPRQGFGREPMTPHNLTLTLTGAALLWVGWYGFNAGSALAADSHAGMAMLVTQMAAATAAVTWLGIEWMLRGRPSALGLVSGAVGGLVAITPAAGYVTPSSALLIGLAAGAGCYIASTSLKRMLGYDDSLDAFGIHGIGGIIGALLTGVFATPAIGGATGRMSAQLTGVGATVVFSALMTLVVLTVVQLVTGLRVAESAESDGLDIAEHGEALD